MITILENLEKVHEIFSKKKEYTVPLPSASSHKSSTASKYWTKRKYYVDRTISHYRQYR